MKNGMWLGGKLESDGVKKPECENVHVAQARGTDRLLNVAEVAKWLGVSPAWVRDHASGKRRPVIPCVKMGEGRVVYCFRRDSVLEFIREQEKWAMERDSN